MARQTTLSLTRVWTQQVVSLTALHSFVSRTVSLIVTLTFVCHTSVQLEACSDQGASEIDVSLTERLNIFLQYFIATPPRRSSAVPARRKKLRCAPHGPPRVQLRYSIHGRVARGGCDGSRSTMERERQTRAGNLGVPILAMNDLGAARFLLRGPCFFTTAQSVQNSRPRIQA